MARGGNKTAVIVVLGTGAVLVAAILAVGLGVSRETPLLELPLSGNGEAVDSSPKASQQRVNASKKVTAICFVGGLRTFEFTRHSLQRNVVDALEPNAALRRIFFETTVENDCASNLVNVKRNVGFLEECSEQASRNQAVHRGIGSSDGQASNDSARRRALAQWLGAFFDEDVLASVRPAALGCSDTIMRSHACCLPRERFPSFAAKNISIFDDRYGMLGLAQYTRKRMCLDAILRYARQHPQVDFGYVALVRPDLVFLEPLPPAKYLSSLSPRLLVASKEAGASVSDYVFLFPWVLFDSVDFLLSRVFATRCETNATNKFRVPPEYVLVDVLTSELLQGTSSSQALLPYQVFPMSLALLRTPNKAECFRLNHAVHGHGRFIRSTDLAVLARAIREAGANSVAPAVEGPPRVLRIHEACDLLFPQRSVLRRQQPRRRS